uniref:Core-2/I-Branching enzyme n=1 Tax=Steinernema glaseri TaxID=37863 RepID=A0A1I7Z6F9_9BILA
MRYVWRVIRFLNRHWYLKYWLLSITLWTYTFNFRLLSQKTFTSDPHSPLTPDNLYFLPNNDSLDVVFAPLEEYEEMVNCSAIAEGDARAIRRAKRWKFDGSFVWETIYPSYDRCKTIKSMFSFADRPLSREEALFPLAYGMLLYQNSVQVLYLLSAIYQPQNQFCIAIDSKASTTFKRQMEIIANCFPNIHIIYVPPISWCGYSVTKGVFACLQSLIKLKSEWNYYQYLSGTDLPLKTNLEMVRIFKAMNGSFNSGIADYPYYRIREQTRWAPLPLFKSSLSATFSRASASYLLGHRKTTELLFYVSKTECSDESLWTTLAGNPEYLQVPGGFNAALLRKKLLSNFDTLEHYRGRTRFGLYRPEKYYISRFQTWFTDRQPCYGKLVQFSCVYGIRDIPAILARPELVAHKFYLDYQPAAFFCTYEAVRRRTLSPNLDFDAREYAKLPGPRMMRGERLEDIDVLSPMAYQFF